MTNPTSMKYGSYELVPVPLITIQRNYLQVKNRDNPVAYNFTMTLRGTVIPDTPGIISVNDEIEDIRQAFSRDGYRLSITCGSTEIMGFYPRIKSVSFDESNNNWVETVPYSIELEYDNDELNENSGDMPPYIEEYSEEWQCEFANERKKFTWDLSSVTNQQSGYGYDYAALDGSNPWEARVTHSINITGKQSWGATGSGATGTSTSAVDNAMEFVSDILNVDTYTYNGNYGHGLSGWTNLVSSSGNDWEKLDHYRSHTINETNGSVSLSETWVILGNNSGISGQANKRIVEDFTVEIRKSLDSSLASISINGTITGHEQRTYEGNNLTNNVVVEAYTSAKNGWDILQSRIFPRAQYVYEQEFAGRVNHVPVTKSVGHNPSQGTITYSYEFNDRPCSFISGSLSENFTIIDNNPSDVFARIPVLGRAAGPVLQEISTVTEATREVTIEAVMPTPTGCLSITDLELFNPAQNVKNLMCEFETQLTTAYNQVFKNSDSENWTPLSGRYSRSVSWTYQSCTGAPSTSMC